MWQNDFYNFNFFLFLSLYFFFLEKNPVYGFLTLNLPAIKSLPGHFSPMISYHSSSLSLQPQGQNAYENHYENNVSLCLRNVAYMFGASFLFLLCGVFVLRFVEVSMKRGKLPGERWMFMFLFLFFPWFLLLLKGSEAFPQKQRWELDGERLRLPGHNVLSALSVFDSISLRKTQKSNVPWAIPLVRFLCVCVLAGLCVLKPVLVC